MYKHTDCMEAHIMCHTDEGEALFDAEEAPHCCMASSTHCLA